MTPTRSRFGAPWARSLKVVSVGATAVVLGVALLQARYLPGHLAGGWLRILVVGLLLALPLAAAPFAITGYELGPAGLRVRRLLGSTHVRLEGLTRAWSAPDAMAGSLRLFGNGGLFVFAGLFYSRRLGRYRALVTDPGRPVVLELPTRKLVVSPDSPEDFLQRLRELHPRAEFGDPARAAGAT